MNTPQRNLKTPADAMINFYCGMRVRPRRQGGVLRTSQRSAVLAVVCRLLRQAGRI